MVGFLIIIGMVGVIFLLRYLLPMDVQMYGSGNICEVHSWVYENNRLKCSVCRRTPEEIISSIGGRDL